MMETQILDNVEKRQLLVMCNDEKLFPEYDSVKFQEFEPIGGIEEESRCILDFKYKHEHRYIDEQTKVEVWAHDMHFLELCLHHIPKRIFEYHTKDLSRSLVDKLMNGFKPNIKGVVNAVYDLYISLINRDAKSANDFRLESLREFFKSEDHKDYFADLKMKQEVMSARVERAGKYLESKSDSELDSLLDRFKKEHKDKYDADPYINGCEPSFNHKIGLFTSYVFENGVDVYDTIEDNTFLGEAKQYKNYIVMLFQGQGAFVRIMKEDPKTKEFETFLQE